MTTARDLSARLAVLLAKEHGAMADFLLALADFDRRRLWAELGHASLFSYLRRHLGLSAGAAQYRKTAAELVQRFPEVEVALRGGRLCLSTVIELAKVITVENQAEILPRFLGLSRREAEALAASLSPVEVVPRREVVTAVRSVSPSPAGRTERAPALALRLAEPESGSANPPEPSGFLAPPPVRESVKPLDGEVSRWHLTVSRRLLEKVDAARAALSHSHPGATTEEILEAGLDLVLERTAKRRGLVERPRAASQPSKPGRVPARVKREVFTRAQGRCEAPLASGGVCGSTRRLELHHVVPLARGGPSTPENVRLLCDAHHDRESRAFFGDEWMDRFRRRRA